MELDEVSEGDRFRTVADRVLTVVDKEQTEKSPEYVKTTVEGSKFDYVYYHEKLFRKDLVERVE